MTDSIEIRDSQNIPLRKALEFAKIGMAPALEGPEAVPIGSHVQLGPLRAVVVGYGTREEFVERIVSLGGSPHGLENLEGAHYQQLQIVLVEQPITPSLFVQVGETTKLDEQDESQEFDLGMSAAWAHYFFGASAEEAIDAVLPSEEPPSSGTRARVARGFSALMARVKATEERLAEPPAPGTVKMFVVFASTVPPTLEFDQAADQMTAIYAADNVSDAEGFMSEVGPPPGFPYCGIVVVEMRYYVVGSNVRAEEEFDDWLMLQNLEDTEIVAGPFGSRAAAEATRRDIQGWKTLIVSVLTDDDAEKFPRASRNVN